MKIFITIPAFNPPHGGLRIIMEWANRLVDFGHEIYLHSLKNDSCEWFDINTGVHICSVTELENCDCLIITSPHSIHFLDKWKKKAFVFCQMAEHMFNKDHTWQRKCDRFYKAPVPMIAISQWNINYFYQIGRRHETHYIGNGVNLEHFPISEKEKDGTTILVEGWEHNNSSKDHIYLGPTVAEELKKRGKKIIAFSQKPLVHFPKVPHEYYVKPDLKTMNELYDRATILIKASRFDARSCSPMEAMTKGTPTARAIIKGDDDLMNYYNCLRSGYDYQLLLSNCWKLLTNHALYSNIQKNCLDYVQRFSWDIIMNQINSIIEA